jgi:hypothetical protein
VKVKSKMTCPPYGILLESEPRYMARRRGTWRRFDFD